MEKSLSDLLSDALETSFPDLDFENFHCDGKREDDETDEKVPRQEDKAPKQEGTAETAAAAAAAVCSMETKDMTERVAEDQPDEENDKEDFQTQEEDDYTSSEGDSEPEGSVSGEDEVDEEEDVATAEEPGELWMSESFHVEFCSGDTEDGISAEAEPLAPEDVENTPIRKKEQGENVGIEEESCSGGVFERSNEMMMINTDGIEEGERARDEDKEEDTSDPARESTEAEPDGNILALVEVLREGESEGLDLQGLIVGADGEEYVEKMKDYCGEEHEEAGESFADYPSDFSSCEYVEDALKSQDSYSQSRALPHTSDRSSDTADVTWVGTDDEDLEMDADALVSLRGAVEENEGRRTEIVDEADSDSSTDDDEVQARRSEEELLDNLENDETPAFSMWSIPNDREDAVDFSAVWDLDATAPFLSENLLTTEDTDDAEATSSDGPQCPAEDIHSYSVVQRGDNKAVSPSHHGSLDDSFFNRGHEISELRALGDDRHDEKRTWGQEREIINSYFQFDDDSDGETEREERQIKVHFCTESLSQVIHYEIESSSDSDVDSLSSSTDREEDLSSAETSEEVQEPDNSPQVTPGCDLPNTQPPESPSESPSESPAENDHTDAHICSTKHKCLSMLKLMLKMAVVVAVGLLMFWLATEQPDWLSPASFYKH